MVVHLFDGLFRLPSRLGPAARIDKIGGEELELRGQILAIGGAAEVKGIVADLEIESDGLSGKQALQIVDAVFSKAPGDEREIRQQRKARPGRGLCEATGPNPDIDPDRVCLEVGFFQVEADAVGERDQVDAEVVNVLAVRNGARRPEIGIGKRLAGHALGRLERDRAARLVDTGDNLLGCGALPSSDRCRR